MPELLDGQQVLDSYLTVRRELSSGRRRGGGQGGGQVRLGVRTHENGTGELNLGTFLE